MPRSSSFLNYPLFHTRQKAQPELSSHIKHSEDNTSYAWELIWQSEQLAINVVCTSYLLVSKIINTKKKKNDSGWEKRTMDEKSSAANFQMFLTDLLVKLKYQPSS